MIYSKEELKQMIAAKLKLCESSLESVPINIKNSMTSKLEDDNSDSIFRFFNKDSGIYLVAKVKTNAFIDNVGLAMNYYKDAKFAEEYARGNSIFYTRECFRREKYVYEQIDSSFAKYVPQYYGSIESGNNCVYIIEYLDICQQAVDLEAAAVFIAKLHVKYLNSMEDAIKMHINIHTKYDYTNAKNLSMMLLHNVESLYPDFSRKALIDLRTFVLAFEENFDKLSSERRTICHGDFCVKNMTFLPIGIKVYDWELSTFNNPEFDLSAFLVHYPTCLNEKIVSSFMDSYLKCYNSLTVNKISAIKLREMLRFNVYIYMTTRFNAMMNICQFVSMPYMKESIYNWQFLYNYLK